MSRNYTLSNFYPHKGNEVAFLAAKKIIELPGEVFNPFYLYGADGLGKTHLLNALNDELSKKFVTHFLSARGFEKSVDANRTFDSPLIIDDIQMMRDEYKDRLLEVIERAVNENIQVCLSADVAPQHMKQFKPRFRSLIESGLSCELCPPDEADRIEIINKKAEQAGIIIPDDLAALLAQVSIGSISTISNMINRLVTYSSLGDLPSDTDTVKSILQEFYPKKKVCATPSVLEMIKNSDIWELNSAGMPDLKAEYDKKTTVWQLKGFDVTYLKENASADALRLRRVFQDFTKRARRLVDFQRILRDRVHEMNRTEAMRIESMLYDVADLEKIEKLLGTGARPARTFRKFVSFIIGASNREVWRSYHEEVLENMGLHNPCFVVGSKGTGKTHFLEAICDDLLSRKKSVAFYDLADKKVALEPGEVGRSDILILDNFHVVQDDEGLLDAVISMVKGFTAADKQIFIGTLPPLEDTPQSVKTLLDEGLILELGKPSADIVTEYIRRLMPEEAHMIIGQGIPGFDSFLEIEYYLKSLGDGESMVIPLGLPGEDLELQAVEGKCEPISGSDTVKGSERLQGTCVDIRESVNYMIPDSDVELVEETF
jgi:chromosomal replication initiation ATPase DnaA